MTLPDSTNDVGTIFGPEQPVTHTEQALTEAVAGLVNEVASWEKNHGNVYMDGSHALKVSTVNKAKQAANDIIMLVRAHDEQATTQEGTSER